MSFKEKKTMPPKGYKCAVGNHSLNDDSVLVQNPRHVEFIRKNVKNFRPENELCRVCFESIKKAFNIKHQRQQDRLDTRSVSSTATTISSIQSDDSIESLGGRTPGNRQLKDISKQYLLSPKDNNPETVDNNNDIYSSVDTDSTNSSEAVVPNIKSKSTKLFDVSSAESDDSCKMMANELAAPQSVKQRLPHFHLAFKRRQMVHLNKDVLDMLLSDTTTG